MNLIWCFISNLVYNCKVWNKIILSVQVLFISTSELTTCFVEKIKYLTNLDKAYFIWHQWSFYNLFYKLRHINRKLYDIFKPHALYGNCNWNKTFNIFLKLKKFNLNWANITHKEIYLKLKDLSSKKTQIISLNKKVISWNKIICNTKKFKYKINNKE